VLSALSTIASSSVLLVAFISMTDVGWKAPMVTHSLNVMCLGRVNSVPWNLMSIPKSNPKSPTPTKHPSVHSHSQAARPLVMKARRVIRSSAIDKLCWHTWEIKAGQWKAMKATGSTSHAPNAQGESRLKHRQTTLQTENGLLSICLHRMIVSGINLSRLLWPREYVIYPTLFSWKYNGWLAAKHLTLSASSHLSSRSTLFLLIQALFTTLDTAHARSLEFPIWRSWFYSVKYVYMWHIPRPHTAN
jgi:hypothetical protein